MGRWRPPAPKSAPYITATGFETLQKEQQRLWVRRKDVVKALSAAAAEGDRSENAEYIYRKKELAGIDRRIRYLQKRLPELTVVSRPGALDQVFFGAFVALVKPDGQTVEYRIVGADETDSKLGYISLDSPMAKALMKKHEGDLVNVRLGDREEEFEVLSIRYTTDP
ncbi:MAG: GreA/GreB family elongation factor [Pseudomonadota bacterium]